MGIDPRELMVKKQLEKVRVIVPIVSGKGGVGKSTLSALIALNLKAKRRVGLLDLDFYGASQHVLLGAKIERPVEEKGVVPPEVSRVRFMSIVFYSNDEALAFRGVDATNAFLELLSITRWGELDYLIIDMPPGLGDIFLNLLVFLFSIF